MMSLRQRLLLFLLLPLLPLSAALMGLLFWTVRSAATEAYDRVLSGSALAIADRVVLENGQLVVDLPYAALQMLTNSAEDRVFYAVVEWPNGEVITGYRSLTMPSFEDGATILQDIDFRGEPMRMIAIKDQALSYGSTKNFVVMVAETTGQRRQVTSRYIRRTVIALSLGVVVVALLTFYAVFLGLKPLRTLADAVSLRGERDMRAIRRAVPAETRPLVSEINALFGRLETSLAAHRSFVSNTAHQLRTPLAELKTELEVAQIQETAPDMEALAKRVDGLAHLVDQMMLLSRVGEAPNAERGFESLKLEDVARQAVEDWSLRAYRAGVDLGLDIKEGESFPIQGHRGLLLEAVGNLIDNIIKHAHAATSATVQVSGTDLVITDNGRGFRATTQDEPSVQRFGLSIVEEIMTLHGGKMTKNLGPKAKVRLSFQSLKDKA